jgi:hypothetical protein
MIRSAEVFATHCAIFCLFVISSAASPFIRSWDPAFFDEIFFPIYAAFTLLTVTGWLPCFGGCVLTKLENQLRKQENLPTYQGPCITHYLCLWTGRLIPKRTVNIGLAMMILLPVLVWFF